MYLFGWLIYLNSFIYIYIHSINILSLRLLSIKKKKKKLLKKKNSKKERIFKESFILSVEMNSLLWKL